MDKVGIIAQTLRTQAEKAGEQAEAAKRNSSEIEGARQALELFYKEVQGLAEVLDKELENPKIIEKLEGESPLATARAWVRRYIARISTMAHEASKHQARSKQVALGRMEQAEAFRDSLLKTAELEVAKARRRAELEAEAEKQATEEAPPEAQEEPAPEKKKPKRKPRTRRKKKEE